MVSKNVMGTAGTGKYKYVGRGFVGIVISRRLWLHTKHIMITASQIYAKPFQYTLPSLGMITWKPRI